MKGCGCTLGAVYRTLVFMKSGMVVPTLLALNVYSEVRFTWVVWCCFFSLAATSSRFECLAEDCDKNIMLLTTVLLLLYLLLVWCCSCITRPLPLSLPPALEILLLEADFDRHFDHHFDCRFDRRGRRAHGQRDAGGRPSWMS